MSFLEPVELPKPKIGPELMIGVSSPLWAYFSAAAMGGLTYWWMTQWTRPANVEAMFGRSFTALPQNIETSVAEALDVAEELAAPLISAAQALAEPLPNRGGETASITPLAPVEAVVETPPMVAKVLVEAAPEPPSFQPEPPGPEPLAVAAEPPAAAAPVPKAKTPVAAKPPAGA